MYCKRCGTENGDNMSFCKECGAPLEKINIRPQERQTSYDDNSNFNTSNHMNSNATATNSFSQGNNYTGEPYIPEEYKPISMWGYFGYQILFSIPLVGLILLLVFSFGGTKNKNLKNFARSYFCFLIVLLILVFFVLGGTGIGALLR